MEVSTPEAHHQLPVSSEDSDETDLLHLGPGRGRRVVYSIGWGKRTKRIRTYGPPPPFPLEMEPKCNQGSIITGAHRPEETTDIRRVKTAREVTGNPNQRGTCQTPTKMISLSLGHENYLHKQNTSKDLVEIHHIKQRNRETTRTLCERYKAEVLDVEEAPECMKISGFMHGITHPELIKRLYEKIPRSMDEMYRVTTSFLQGEVAAFSSYSENTHAPWRQPEKETVKYQKGSKTRKGQIRSQIGEEDGTEGPMIIEAEIGGHFNKKARLNPATTSLIGFSGGAIWLIGQISLLVKIGEE
ncbi:hypothetical protein Tco_1282290 [Tanacetum coccineum]